MNNIKQLSDLYPLMMQQLPGIDTYTLLQHLQQAQRKFCKDTQAWTEELSAIDLVESQTTYTITPSWDCRIDRVTKLWLRSDGDVTNGLEGTIYDEEYYNFYKPETLELAQSIKPRADQDDGLVVEVVLIPEITQTGDNVISIEFLNDYAEGIMEWAFYTLKMLPKERWTDRQMAQVHLKDYLSAVTDAMGDVQLNGKTQPAGFSG